MPVCKIRVGKMLRQDADENVPLSNSTKNKRTDDMSHDAEEFCVMN
jgi:hypothetical protein